MNPQPFVSVIVPVRNAPHDLTRCLEAIKKSSYSRYEIIVVDDASTDETGEVARTNGAAVLRLPTQSGPGAARNQGAEKAKGEILFFIDSDVLVHQDTIDRVVKDFSDHPDVGALFGSYDDDPAAKNFFSQYMNLRHHFVHQMSQKEAVTFWAGCGAVRKDVFFSVGGFDKEKYSRPCIEDIEMGYRLKKRGHRILLDKLLQVKHLKRWTFKSLLRADILNRAVPWAHLIMESQEMVTDLNLQKSQKISAGLVALIIIITPISFYIPKLIWLILLLLGSVLVINHKLFNFFLKRNGFKFAALAFAMHFVYFFYSGATFSLCWLSHRFRT
jgi:glycosyltransferase involved in cell wall biosynthesis